MRELISLEEARKIIFGLIKPVSEENITLPAAMGRVLSQDILAPVSLPPFNRSPLDGYAVRAIDISSAKPEKPVKLKIVNEIPAGISTKKIIDSCQAARIFTGAPIPDGADVIIKQEDVWESEGMVYVTKPLPAYSNYCFAGEDVKKGEVILVRGTNLKPAEIGILAGLGLNCVPVYRVPRIAIISVGDELVDIDETLQPGKIYNSNQFALAAYVLQMGALPVRTGKMGDKLELIANEIEKKLQDTDLIITTGGASVGDYDYVKEALKKIGAKILFWRVNIRPGTPVIGAVKNGKVILGLSGNPAAAQITFHLLAGPAIDKLMNKTKWQQVRTTAILQDEFSKPSRQRRFLKGFAYLANGMLEVKLTGSQSSGVMKSMLNCNALVDVPARSKALKMGDEVEILFLRN